MVLFVFQFYPVYNFGKFISFELGAVRSELRLESVIMSPVRNRASLMLTLDSLDARLAKQDLAVG